MNEFDDPQMERMLGAAGGAYPDVNTAFAQVQGRVRHIKRRRAMVASGAACALLAVGAVYALGRTDQRGNLQPGDRGSLSVDTSEVESSQSSVPESTDTTDDTSSPDSSTPAQGSQGSQGNTGTGHSTSTTAHTSTATTVRLNTVPLGPTDQQFTSVGGSLTVQLVSGHLVFVSATPNGGFVLDQKSVSNDRIEVRFRSATHDSRIRLDLIGTSVQPSIEEQANS